MKDKNHSRKNRLSGFTLIEISIVLVIIGVIIGGVLAAKQMIESAEISATIAQKTAFDSATAAFKNQYDCLPGDCADAIEKGISVLENGIPTTIQGSGNGIIGGPMTGGAQEATLYWGHLSATGLISGKYNYNFAANGPGNDSPHTKFRSKNGWRIWCDATGTSVFPDWDSTHSFDISNKSVSNVHVTSGADTPVLAPEDAKILDNKIDDGLPISGNVRAFGATNVPIPFTPDPCPSSPYNHASQLVGDPTSCLADDGNGGFNRYNIGNESPACHIIIKAQF